MEKYKFTIDEKVSIWKRIYITVEANNIEEAIEKCKDEEYEVEDSEYLNWTEELEESDDFATYEIRMSGDFSNLLYSNNNR